MLAVAGTAAAEGEWSGNVALSTDYVWRGVSQSNEDMAISGGTKVPIETLSAVFSHVYRGARSGQNTADGATEHALDSNFSS